MDKFNNMGGIIFASILFISEFKLFSVLENKAIVSLKNGHEWRNLPISSTVNAPDISTSESASGTIYSISVTIPILRACLSEKEAHVIRTGIIEGCILMCQDVSGYKYIYGTPEHPLQGTLTNHIGKKRTDLSTYELDLSGKSAYPQLILAKI